MISQVFSGARTVFSINTGTGGARVVGYALGCSGTTGINYQPLEVLGHLETVEHVPVSYRVELSANMARISTGNTNNPIGSRVSDNSTYGNETSTSPQLMPSFNATNGLSILQSGELEATIKDIVTDSVLYTIRGVKCSQKSFEIQAGGMVSENCTFVARISLEGGENPGIIGV